jgi:cephalosporin hydroxylase
VTNRLRCGAVDTAPPPRISLGLDDTILKLWRARAEQSQRDSYAGVRLVKLPEDLRVYEHLIWISSTNCVIELGAQEGGSALWFRDRLRLLQAYGRIRSVRVISVDLDTTLARDNLSRADPAYSDTIQLIDGDLRDPAVAAQVASSVNPDAAVLVVDDSAHTYETTTAALTRYSHHIKPGGFFVVEDGGVDIEEVRLDPAWPRGVIPAIQAWLGSPSGAEFEMRRDLELYGLTSNPQGILRRRA